MNSSINLPELRSQFKGLPISELVQHHLCRYSQYKRTRKIKDSIAMLPDCGRDVVEEFIDLWNLQVYEKDFWKREASDLFDDIIADARSALQPIGLENDDEAALTLFNIIVMNYAYNAYDQPKMREFMGITCYKFPWPSAIGLLYPTAATLYIATFTPAGGEIAIGYGIANLGYLLFMAGALRGTFRIFGLKKRWSVYGAAVGCFLLGTVILNVFG